MKWIAALLFLNSQLFSALPIVSPKEFSGLWYEIARTPNDYEKDCVAATVEYTLKSSNQYYVTNRCFDGVIGGDLIVYNGTAKTLQNDSASKLKLTYFWVFSREYHLLHWEGKYAIMSSPDYKHLWIMSRTPQMPKTIMDRLLKKLTGLINTDHLIFTPQDPKGRYQ